MKPPLILSSCDSFFSLHEYYLANPNGETVCNWISNNISKFHDNPTVEETEIIVLPRQLWVSTGKENATMRRVFVKLRHYFKIPNGENARNWFLNLVLKFHDDPTVNESEIVIFLRQVWWSAGKRKGFERRKEKNENEAKRRHLT